MKFLVDAQLPRRLAYWLTNAGFDAIHTLDLPQGNATTDDRIISVADDDDRIVVTKDDDFMYAHLARATRSGFCSCVWAISAIRICCACLAI